MAVGHAEAGVAGDDIVCAAASAILQAAELGLTSYAAVPGAVTRGADGMTFVISESVRDRADVKAIVGTAELAIAQLAWQFPINVRIVRDLDEPHASADVEFLGKH